MAPINPIPVAAPGGYLVNLNVGRPCKMANATGHTYAHLDYSVPNRTWLAWKEATLVVLSHNGCVAGE